LITAYKTALERKGQSDRCTALIDFAAKTKTYSIASDPE